MNYSILVRIIKRGGFVLPHAVKFQRTDVSRAFEVTRVSLIIYDNFFQANHIFWRVSLYLRIRRQK